MSALALHYMSVGHYPGAIMELKQRLAEDPDNGVLHALLSRCLLATRRLVAAETEAETAMALDPTSGWCLSALIRVRLSQDRIADARELAEQYIALDPTNPSAWEVSADVADRASDRERRRVDLHRALALAPDDPDVLADLSECAREDGDLDKAQAFAEQALAAAPMSAAGRLAMGEVYLQRGDTEGAHAMAVEVLRGNPSHQGAITLLASVKAAQSPIMGLWWRYASWMMRHTGTEQIWVLMGAYVLYRLLTQVLTDLGYEGLTGTIEMVWVGVCIYTWVGPSWFQNMLRRELETVSLDEEY